MVDYKNLAEEEIKTKFDWRDTLVRGKGGLPLSSIENYIIYLENSPKYKGKMKYNEFTNKREFDGAAYSINIFSGICLDIEKEFGSKNRADLEDALRCIYDKYSYDPVKDYLKSLKWDGVKRVETLFIDLLEAEDNELTRFMTKKWLTAGVSRVMCPGCKFDNILVLTGAQGTGKSTICERLSKGFYNTFSFNDISTTNKDNTIKLTETWIAVFDELDALSKRDTTQVKNFLSSTKDNVRKPYCPEDVDIPRRCVFIGSTNDREMLRDSTGNRRFWVLDCHKTKRDGKVQDTMTPEFVDQIWAEAYQYYMEDPNQKLDIPEDMIDTFEKSQVEHNGIYNDAAASFLDVFLDRKFDINKEGEVCSYDDLRCPDDNGCNINKIPVFVIDQVLKAEKFQVGNIKSLISVLPDWEYKNTRYKKLNKVVKSLVRKVAVKQEKKPFDPMDAFNHLK